MPYLSRKQIAEICGIDKSHSAYVRREVVNGNVKEVRRNGKIRIDTKDKKNLQFLKRKASGNPNVLALIEKINKTGKVPKELNVWDLPISGGEKKTKKETEKSNIDGFYANSIKDVKDIYDAKAKKARLRLLEIEEKKLLGKMIPTDMASETLSIFSDTMQKVFLQKVKSWIMDITHRNKLDEHELGVLRGEMVEIVNSAFKKSVSVSKKKLKDVIDDIMAVGEYNTEEDE